MALGAVCQLNVSRARKILKDALYSLLVLITWVVEELQER